MRRHQLLNWTKDRLDKQHIGRRERVNGQCLPPPAVVGSIPQKTSVRWHAILRAETPRHQNRQKRVKEKIYLSKEQEGEIHGLITNGEQSRTHQSTCRSHGSWVPYAPGRGRTTRSSSGPRSLGRCPFARSSSYAIWFGSRIRAGNCILSYT